MGRKGLYFILVLVVLTACIPRPKFELYEGDSLHIAMIGEAPDVKEEQVNFTKIKFDELIGTDLNSYDAVFISENNLFEAAESQYADVYSNSAIPVFFIGTEMYFPFTEKEIEYDKAWDWSAGQMFAVGVVNSKQDDKLIFWKYGLYNDEKTEEHIEDVYSRILGRLMN